MLSRILAATLIIVSSASVVSAQNPTVTMKTSMGTMTIELYADKAPATVENFLAYVDMKFFDGTIFHRVIPGFMIQGGGFEPSMMQKSPRAQIQNEADNGISNTRGTLAMARTNDPHSASSQWFINSVDNDMLDHESKSADGWGYCVFGKVTAGLDVIDKISAVQTENKRGHANVPATPVLIESVTRN